MNTTVATNQNPMINTEKQERKEEPGMDVHCGEIKRGEIYWVDFGKTKGSEQGGKRPALVVQNNIGNKHSPTTIVVAITSKRKPNLPTHVILEKDALNGLSSDSFQSFFG